jgi:hypothetical protein
MREESKEGNSSYGAEAEQTGDATVIITMPRKKTSNFTCNSSNKVTAVI